MLKLITTHLHGTLEINTTIIQGIYSRPESFKLNVSVTGSVSVNRFKGEKFPNRLALSVSFSRHKEQFCAGYMLC
jgi:hypothetical protein